MAVQKVIDLSTEKFIHDISEINPKYDDSAIIKAYEQFEQKPEEKKTGETE